ncbi:MAG: hypothetical protein QOI63_413, partial [Thermoplasmata archaeon]|nr:hypothetical protein [Thermoplasmata archaeon]
FGLGTYAVGAGVRGTILTECASGLPWWQ